PGFDRHYVLEFPPVLVFGNEIVQASDAGDTFVEQRFRQSSVFQRVLQFDIVMVFGFIVDQVQR
ncbi:MAG: hypothetical protein WAW17_07175, partial [Rhodococcus sp. (in: high G+C Gram-positive bacteria)]|uniref:hypothetical protein n=1 Tax=Rhodococcus sp. TaxID=1831 RepID=UPI003BAE7EA3